MASLADAFGPDQGQQAWDSMTEILGNEFRGQVLMSLLTGQTGFKIKLHGKLGYRQTTSKYVEFIKTIRRASGYGLKEAKDCADMIDQGSSQIIPTNCDSRARRQLIADFRDLGITAS